MSELQKFPISILSGFLGAGKTTLLKKLLRAPDMSGTAVIINEFGEVGLDHLLVKQVAPDVLQLPNGCLCCALRGDVVRTLAELLELRAAGTAVFERVVIETSGLADPTPIIATVSSHPYLEAAFRMSSVAIAIDTTFGGERYETYPEALAQLVVADAVILTKTDLVPPKTKLLDYLRSMNPAAMVLISEDLGKVADLLSARTRVERRRFSPAVPVSSHGLGISSLSLSLSRPMSRLEFARCLGGLTMERGEDLLRIKGFVKFSDTPRAGAAINAVQHTLYPPEWLDEWPDDDPRGRLVIIGRDLDVDDIVRRFAGAGAASWVSMPDRAA